MTNPTTPPNGAPNAESIKQEARERAYSDNELNPHEKSVVSLETAEELIDKATLAAKADKQVKVRKAYEDGEREGVKQGRLAERTRCAEVAREKAMFAYHESIETHGNVPAKQRWTDIEEASEAIAKAIEEPNHD